MSKKIQDMTQGELQQMLDSFSQSVQHISERDIDNYIQCQAMGKEYIHKINHLGQEASMKNPEWQKTYGRKTM